MIRVAIFAGKGGPLPKTSADSTSASSSISIPVQDSSPNEETEEIKETELRVCPTWQWMDEDDVWKDYDEYLSRTFESAYKRDVSIVTLNTGWFEGKNYIVLFLNPRRNLIHTRSTPHFSPRSIKLLPL